MENKDYLNYQIRKLDHELKALGMSDSSVEYSLHIRECFDSVITRVNILKEALEMDAEIIDDYEWYFDKQGED